MGAEVNGHNYKEIYTEFIKNAELTEVDRELLKHKRGFTDEIIDNLQFKSARPENKKIIKELKDKYGEEKLLAAALLTTTEDGMAEPCNQVIDKDKVIIPYLNKQGQVTYMRAHKFGLTGVKIQPYCPYILKDEEARRIVLTESEFKSAACYQLDIPAIGLPGISAFYGIHYQDLVDFLKENKVKEVIIIFDNEVKNEPGLGNYKPDPQDRYDTQFYAYMMAWKLNPHKNTDPDNSFKTKIGVLPDSWMKNGKIDIDGALAQGKTKQDLLNVINSAMTPSEYRNSWSGEEKSILERKIKKEFFKFRTPVTKEFNKYKYIENKGQENEQIKTMSNFTINIKKSYFTNEGVVREVIFQNEYGEESEPFLMDSSDMVGVASFEQFCLSKGNYLWYGSGKHLKRIWEYELVMNDDGKMVYLPERIGEIEPNFWLFKNVCFKAGKEYKPDSDGIFWVDNNRGYLPQAMEDGGETPELYIDNDMNFDKIVKIVETLKSNIGGYEAYIGVGWVIATIYSRPIYNKFKNIPILFPHGKRESGKTTFSRWLMHFFGLENTVKNIGESTQNYIMRALSYYSSLGVWFDEYRNENKITSKNGYLRSAYNRQSAGKGVKAQFGAKSYNVTGTLLLSGEEVPKDSGLFSRIIRERHTATKINREHYKWLENNCIKFSYLTYHLIKNYQELKLNILENIEELKKALFKQDIADRTAENWAIVAASFYVVFKGHLSEEDLQGFVDWVLEQCKDAREVVEEEHVLNVFWNDISVMEDQREIHDRHIKLTTENGRKVIALWFTAIYNKWTTYYRKRTGKEPFDKSSIQGYIQEEKYFVDAKNVWLKDGTRYCYLIDPNHDQAPMSIKELKEVLENAKLPNH